MPVNSTHLDYNAALPAWLRARDVFAGEDVIKRRVGTTNCYGLSCRVYPMAGCLLGEVRRL